MFIRNLLKRAAKVKHEVLRPLTQDAASPAIHASACSPSLVLQGCCGFMVTPA